MKKYKVSNYSIEIEEKEIIRETEKMVVFINSRGKEDKELKSSNYSSYFDTYNEAANYHIYCAAQKVEMCEIQLKYANECLKEAMQLLDGSKEVDNG